MSKIAAILLSIFLLVSCTSVPKVTKERMEHRFVLTNIEYPIDGMVIITLYDLDTEKEYIIVALKDNGTAMERTR